jgi:predicted RNA-binding Zn ribbon-like protein
MRASEDMREDAVETLQRRFAEGYLSPATLEERLGRVLRAKTQEAVALTLEDLPPEKPAWRLLLQRGATRSPAAVPHSDLDLSAHVGAGRVLLGRDPGCGIVLSDATVSRRHAELRVDGDVCRIKDLGSTNGTFANGRAVTAARLKEGDAVTFGLLAVRLVWSS